MNASEAYENIRDRARQIALLDSAQSVLAWDQETYMPSKASPYRAEQLSYLAGRIHEMAVAPEIGEWLSVCEESGDFPAESKEHVNLREWRREYDRETKLPTAFVEELSKTQSLARDAWVAGKKNNDFPVFQPFLEKLVGLARRAADYYGYETEPYDALLDTYEPGIRATELTELFGNLRRGLAEILPEAVEKSKEISPHALPGHYPQDGQRKFLENVVGAFGFDFDSGRIDETEHPFCTRLGESDFRLTTRFDEQDLMFPLYGSMHEAGHGMYEQGLPRGDDYSTPCGSSAWLSVHESQSRLWENKIGRRPDFWNYWYPVAVELLPDLKRFTPEFIARFVNRAAPSLIRVEADEMTYDLHIILRFELELPLIRGEIQVTDVPALWKEKMKDFLNIEVPDDSRGCLQDIHWSFGAFGYFPTYTLGNLISAQLYAKIKEEISGLDGFLAEGSYEPVLRWLREKVHQHGQRYHANELVERVTGQPLGIDAHLAYLREKASIL